MSYPLYHTLNKDLPTGKSPNVKKLINYTKSELTEQKKTAILMLIAEHAKINDNYDFNIDKLPYGMEQNNENVIIYIEKFPVELQWILWKFFQI